MILVDTSIWIDHLHAGLPSLSQVLDDRRVLGHPFVTGEIACGHLRHRARVLGTLGQLPQAPLATDDEVLGLIERHRLMGKGIGYIDAHLLASTALAAPARLWTADARLRAIAHSLGLAYLAGNGTPIQ